MPSVHERFLDKVTLTDTCWNWTASVEGKGYGQFRLNGRMIKAHRYMYEFAIGPIPEGLQIDHVCSNRRCVRPDHLRLVTPKQNNEHRHGANKNSRSGIRGVVWVEKHKKWRAVIKHNRRLYHLGHYATPEEAEAVVVAKRRELFSHAT